MSLSQAAARPAAADAGGAVRVRMAADGDRDRWNAFAAKSATPPLNRYEWKGILEHCYGADCHFLLAEGADGKVQGIAAAFVGPGSRVRRLHGLRFGLVCDGAEAETALIRRLRDAAAASAATECTVCSGYRPLLAETATAEERSTLILEVGGSADDCWGRLRDKTRNAIRKGGVGGLVAEWGGHNLGGFHKVYLAAAADKNRPAHSAQFFEQLLAQMGDAAALLAVKIDGEVVGGTIVLFADNVLIYPFQASTEAANRLFAPNSFMIWELVKASEARGIQRIDMGESQPGGGVFRFKRNFGGAPAPVYYTQVTGASAPVGSPTAGTGRSRLGRLRDAVFAASPQWGKRRLALARGRRGRLV